MTSMISSDIGRPSPGRPRHNRRPSRLVVVLAVGASAGVLVASAVGAFTGLVAGGAIAAACGIAVLSYYQAGRGVVADLLTPLPEGLTGAAVIDAPRAAQVAAPAVSHTDAA